MRWGRGLFRIWLVLSVIWVGGFFALERPDRAILSFLDANEALNEALERIESRSAEINSDGDSLNSEVFVIDDEAMKGLIMEKAVAKASAALFRARTEQSKLEVRNYLFIAFVPVLILLALGWAILWAVRGFKRLD